MRVELGKIEEIITQQPHQSNQQLRLLIIPWCGYLGSSDHSPRKLRLLIPLHENNPPNSQFLSRGKSSCIKFSDKEHLTKKYSCWHTSKLHNILMDSILPVTFCIEKETSQNCSFPPISQNLHAEAAHTFVRKAANSLKGQVRKLLLLLSFLHPCGTVWNCSIHQAAADCSFSLY